MKQEAGGEEALATGLESRPAVRVAIACGGTGGHLYPGLAVAEELLARGCTVTLLVSAKAVDQQALSATEAHPSSRLAMPGCDVVTLPAVAWQRPARGERKSGSAEGESGGWWPFARGFWKAWRMARQAFQARPPDAVLAMGGFTSAPAILAARAVAAATFLHEANTIPGRANRWLAPWVDEVFVAFGSAAPRLRNQAVHITGMPVRSQFQPVDQPAPTDAEDRPTAAGCRASLGLDPRLPVLLVTGGSQGARALNQAMLRLVDRLAPLAGRLQILHLTGSHDGDALREAYRAHGLRARVVPYLTEMEFALGAATLAISRAGASSLAELAAVRVPAILVPYPHAAEDHQRHNARAFVGTGAARLWEQSDDLASLAALVIELLEDAAERIRMQQALAGWHTPKAAEQIALAILRRVAPSAARAEIPSAGRQVDRPAASPVGGRPVAVPPLRSQENYEPAHFRSGQ